ncbi:redoxin domain-containing protein [Oscillatoria sp. FACHB-1407]|uniref:thioredoxin-like domain-containing protein n=1 Tax=Oscillatoria sp. FACHB-1407 TaxID=2692847 RepID=UPI001684038F|nr:thioredoxin-like domain-containing protein [Oscillatoria sp. FACHB-1407]MBD2463738.1 redoxin domain-containing protein [Oscillatoria sp. FACHB-1407]
MVRVRAPEIPKHLDWLNSDWLNVAQPGLSLKALRGYVVLLDFWTYGCINCLHIIPDLKFLEQKYGDRLVILGVHTAKFDHENNRDSVQQAILRYGVPHPVVIDRDRHLWDQYAVRAYPTIVVIDPKGYVVRTIVGEGQRQVLDDLIQQVLDEHDSKSLNVVPLPLPSEPSPSLILSPLAFPGKVIADEASDRLFIADTGHHRLVITTLDGSLKAVIGTGEAGSTNGDWSVAQFSAPQGMAFDRQQQVLYVADTGNHQLRCVDLRDQTVKAIAGTGVQSRWLFPHGGQALEVDLNSPWDVVQIENQLYIAMAGSHQIWVMDLLEHTIQTWSGTGAEFCADGSPEVAAFAQPSGLATDSEELFVADSESSSIRGVKVAPVPIARTVCGSGQLFGFGDRDGAGSDVRLQHCLGVVYAEGYLWIADTYNHKVKQVNPTTNECKTVAGGGIPGFQDELGIDATFAEPSGLTYARQHLYVADTNNHVIRHIQLNSLEVSTLPIPDLCSPYVCLPD